MKTTTANERRIFDAMKSISTPTTETVSICGWCPNKEERTQEAVAQGKLVTHGMCPSCSVRLLAELDK